MKNMFWKAAFAAAVILLAVAGTARAQANDHDGCSIASLHGDYAFTLHGESIGVLVPQPTGAPKLVLFASPLLADGVAITNFDGDGHLKQVDFVMRNGTSAATPTTALTDDGFRSGETGRYTVSPDCTGTFTIMFPDTTEIDAAFV